MATRVIFAGRLARPAVAALLTSAALIAGCGGSDEKAVKERPFQPASVASTTPVAPAGTVTTPAGTPRPATVSDARKAIAGDRYADAERALPALSTTERATVRVGIAQRLAKRAREALKKGNTTLVKSLLVQADAYPDTAIADSVQARLKVTEKRTAEDRRRRLLERRAKTREDRLEAAAKRAEAEARAAQKQATQP